MKRDSSAYTKSTPSSADGAPPLATSFATPANAARRAIGPCNGDQDRKPARKNIMELVVNIGLELRVARSGCGYKDVGPGHTSQRGVLHSN